MKTLNNNYKKNIDILKENIKRGLTQSMAIQAIDNMENQFVNSNLYDDEAQEFINEMREVVNSSFIKATDLATSMGIKVVNL